MATQDQIEQQRRVILDTTVRVKQLLNLHGDLAQLMITYTRLGLGDDQFLSDESFVSTGTTKADYRAAILSLDAIQSLLAQGHGTNLEKFAR